MTVEVREDFQAVGSWRATLNNTPEMLDKLTVKVEEKRVPRKLHWCLYDPLGVLSYVGVLLTVTPGEKGIEIGGQGVLWHLGSNDIGPKVDDREYVAGTDKLDNGDFALGGLYWRTPSQGSFWAFLVGTAVNAGGLTKDDVLEIDRKFPTRPGYAYKARIEGATGSGRLRVRTIYEGRFNPVNLLVNPGFESVGGWSSTANILIVGGGARTGVNALRISPIPLPQLVSNSGFESGTTGWTFGPTMTVGAAGLYEGTQGLIAVPNPKPQLITNSGFESGSTGWTLGPTMTVGAGGAYEGSQGLIAVPNPKPELLSNGDFSAGSAGWTLGPTMSVVANALLCAPNPQPQLITDPGFETGAGWSDVLTPAPMSNDIDLVNDSTNAYSGSWVMKVGPVTQHQVFTNADFGNATTLDYWYASSSDADPHAVWAADIGGGNNGTNGVRTTGWSTAGRAGPELIKYLRADAVLGGGVSTYTVVPGDTFRAEAYFRGHPGTDGSAYISIMIPHPTVPGHDEWWVSKELTAPPNDQNRWVSLSIENLTIPTNRVSLNALAEVHNHSLGYWSLDSFTLTRTRGNRARIISNTAYAVAVDTEYRLAMDIRSGGKQAVGSVRLGVILKGAGMKDLEFGTDKGSTDFEWNREVLTVRIPAGYSTATPFVAGQDILGDPVYVDNVTLNKVSNNSDTTTHSVFTVVPDQRYSLSAAVSSAAFRGTLTLGVTFGGSGMTNLDREISQGTMPFGVVKTLSMEVRPPDGYTTATVYVRTTDVEGGNFLADNIRFTKIDNNTDETTGTAVAPTADQRYTLAAVINSPTSATHGSVTIGVRLTGTGVPTRSIEVTQGVTKGEWKAVRTEVRPSEGYTTATPYLITKDIEGANFSVDNFTLTKADNNTDETTHATFPVLIDQRYLLSAAVKSETATTHGTVTVGVRVSGAGLPTQSFQESHDLTKGEWKGTSREVRFPTGYTTAAVFVLTKDIEGGRFFVDKVTLEKSDNNSDASVGTTFAVTPERSYRWTQDVFSGTALQRGNVRLSARCIRAGYPDVTFISGIIDATVGVWETLDFTFTPPSGYNTVSPSIVGTDVEGDFFYVDNGLIVDTDTGTYVVDSVLDNPSSGASEVNTVAPVGSETVRVALVLEQGGTGWTVNGASFKRTGVTPATGNAIVADILKDPNTGLGLSIAAGTLSAPAVIPHDWWVLKRTNRQILQHLVDVIYEPPLEFNINPGLPPTLDVGTRATVFADLVDYILLLSDRQVIEIPPAESNVELRPTEIELIGAERQRLSGRPETITATAQVPGPIEYDFNNRPIVRTETVTDTTVDHQEYADAYAADLAAKRAEPPLQVTIRLSGTELTPCKVGDTIYPYYPAAGLEDLTNPKTVEGETVFPRGVRILSRLSRKGPTHTCTMRNPDGTSFPLVPLWSPEDSTELTVGDRVEDWSADPGGHATSIQFMRDWRSRPR